MILVRFLFQSSRLRILISLATGLAGGLASAAALSLIQPALENAGSPNKFLNLFVPISIASIGLNLLSEHLASIQAQDFLLSLRLKLARQILATPLFRLEQLGVARLLGALTEDASMVANALPGLAQLCPEFAIIIGCFAYMFWLSPWGFIVIASLMILGLSVYVLPQRLAKRATDASRVDGDTLMKHFRALAEGVKQLQIHAGRADFFLEHRLGPAAHSSRRHTLRAFGMYLVGSNVGRAFYLIAIFAILLLAPRFALPGPIMIGFTLTVLYLTRPIEYVLSWLPILNRAQVALSHIHGLGMELEPPKAATVRIDHEAARRIELRQVTYMHRSEAGNSFMMGPIDLVLSSGELLFLVGGNGGGKTTLAKLLVGLYIPDAGHIIVDGQPVVDMDEYRANFSVIFADSFAFEDLGIAGDDAQVARVISEFDLGGFKVEQGRKEPNTLSQGQRKRMLLLSSLIEDRPVYVFDEWAAEQDPAFRKVFYLDILPALRSRGKTVIVITHDDQYFHVADRLLRVEYGNLVAFAEKEAPPGTIEASRTMS